MGCADPGRMCYAMADTEAPGERDPLCNGTDTGCDTMTGSEGTGVWCGAVLRETAGCEQRWVRARYGTG